MSKSKTNEGKVFEKNWAESYVKLPIYYLRLVDAAKWTRSGSSSFTPSNPFDALQFKMPFIWLLELKSTSGTSVSFNPINPDEKPDNKKTQLMIKAHQVKSLLEASKIDGIISGFIINFREKQLKTKYHPDETYFVHISDFIKFAKLTEKSGINRDDCRKIGLMIESRKKKVNYTYDVEEFTKNSPKFYLERGYINRDSLVHLSEYIGKLIS